MTKRVIFDGKKSITFDNYPPEAWNILDGPKDSDYDNPVYLFKRVPWLGRAVKMRMDAVASVPFVIMKGDKEVDNSMEWKNVLGNLTYPRRLLRRVESSLCLFGRSYLLSQVNKANVIKDYRYIAPQTITSQINKLTGEIMFTRSLGSVKAEYGTDRIVYFWYDDDPTIELGPPDSSPAFLALSAAGALMSIDNFVTQYFKRGGVKAQLLTVQGNPPQQERDRLKAWWSRLTGGGGAWKSDVINADTVTPVTVGDGLDGLQDTELTSSKREDICTAMGIPKTMLFSDAATFATSQQDELNFLNYTIIPETEFIEEVMNEQVFNKTGYKLLFQPQTIDSFQEDETRRAQAYQFYVTSGFKPSLAAEMLGLELPAGIEYTVLDEYAPQQTNDTMREDLAKWHRKALKALEKGNSANVAFTSQFIPDNEIKRIQGVLGDCITVEDVNKAFTKPVEVKSDNFSEVVKELKRANDLLDHSTDYMHIMKQLAEPKEIKAGDITVNVPEQIPVVNITNEVNPTPVTIDNQVNVEPTPIENNVNVPEVKQGDVTVNIPEQPAPVVNVTVEKDEKKKSKEKVKVTRDRDGRIQGLEEV